MIKPAQWMLQLLFVGGIFCQAVALADDASLFTEQEEAWIAAHPVINIGIDPEWRPIEYIEDGTFKGLGAEYLKAISRISGLQFRWQPNMDWGAAREAVLNGSVDLLPTISEPLASPELRKRLAYSRPYFVGSTLIVTQASSPVMFDPRQLVGKKVAVKRGGAYERNLRLRYPGIEIIAVNSPAEALQRVSSGAAYAAVDVDAVLIPILEHRYFDTLHVAGSIADMPAVVGIGVRIEEQVLMSIINKSLASLTARETDLMISRWIYAGSYGPPTWSATFGYYFWELCALVLLLVIFVLLLVRASKAQRRSERSERDKAMMLAVLSHEIRTPMNAILSSVELLGRTDLRPADAQLVKVAVASANTLLELLDIVLDFSKLEAQRLVLNYQPTNIGALIAEAVSISEYRAQEKELPLKTQLQWEAPLWLSVDALRLRQVLINLISNAIKFTEAGEVKVSADFAVNPEDGAQGILRVAVIDTGIGVSRRDQQRLFRAFTQADESITRKFGGTGLGLTICRSLMQLMGGKVVFRSELGKGTTIEVLLPARLAVPLKDKALKADVVPAVAAGVLRVLVVEDHPANQFVIERQLQVLRCEVVQALTGQAGLDRFADSRFDILFLDCNLPDIDGYTVARRIRKIESVGQVHTPIIAISAMVGPVHAQACFEAGFDGVLTKPLRIDQVREIIALWCDVRKTSEVYIPLRTGFDIDLSGTFLDTFYQDLEQMHHAATAFDWPQVVYLAHRVAGAAMMLDLPVVVSAAQKLEELGAGEVDAVAIGAAIQDLQGALHKGS